MDSSYLTQELCRYWNIAIYLTAMPSFDLCYPTISDSVSIALSKSTTSRPASSVSHKIFSSALFLYCGPCSWLIQVACLLLSMVSFILLLNWFCFWLSCWLCQLVNQCLICQKSTVHLAVSPQHEYYCTIGKFHNFCASDFTTALWFVV